MRYKETVYSIEAVHSAMNALDRLNKEYRVTRKRTLESETLTDEECWVKRVPKMEWVIEEVDEHFLARGGVVSKGQMAIVDYRETEPVEGEDESKRRTFEPEKR